MKLSIRKLIYQYPLLHNLSYEIVSLGNWSWYRMADMKFKYSKKIKALENTKAGLRCFIIGNGPSITIEDLNKLKDEDTFAFNKIFKVFNETSWRPLYYMTQDRYVVSKEEYEKLELDNIFTGAYYSRKISGTRSNFVYFDKRVPFGYKNIKFSEDPSKQIYDGYTITYSALQLAIYMGYKQIYLLGIDHNYQSTKSKNKIIVSNQTGSHFYQGEKNVEVIGLTEYSEYAYESAKKFADSNGIKIYNATRGGKLEIFERINFDDLFKQNEVKIKKEEL